VSEVTGEDPDVGGPAREGRPGRRHRRVVVPPTNPCADQSDDVPAAGPRRAAPEDDAADTPRDRWIREQRPPHWD